MQQTPTTVKNGIDRPALWRPATAGKRIGLITNHSGLDRDLHLTSDILHEAGVLRCLFAPEHGVRGDRQAGDHIASYTDEATGLPVYSLYGGNHHLPPEVLASLDAVAFDIQDVGARFYTYMYTLSYALEDCAAAGVEVIVFDRLNPLGGAIQGSLLSPECASFVGRFPIATRHGLTLGEFARWVCATRGIDCHLTVIGVEGWTRSTLFCESDLSWVAPSPNIPTADTCFSYIGTCLFEGSNLSEGRGTTRPFELIGAPWLDAQGVIDALRGLQLPGVKLRHCYFTPMFSKHAGALCRGIQLHITDRRVFLPFETGLYLIDTIRRMHGEFELTPPDANGIRTVDRLLGSTAFSRAEDFSPEAFIASQKAPLQSYRAQLERIYLYD